MRRFSFVVLFAILPGLASATGEQLHEQVVPAANHAKALAGIASDAGAIRHFSSPAEPRLQEVRDDDPPGAILGGPAIRESIVISEALVQRPPARTDEALDDLFVRLEAAEDATAARGVVMMINRRWLRSGSDTADLLMARARQAARERDHALAVELLDRVITMQPDWAEAWNRRSVAFHRLGDPLAAMADIHRTVTLEPRHFAAWAGLGHILRESGDEAAALASYEHALSIHPYIPRLQPIVEKLRRDLYGMDL